MRKHIFASCLIIVFNTLNLFGAAPNKEKVELGKKLFFDPRLSKTANVSCNSCHNVSLSGDDSRPTSVGIRGQLGGRNAPTVWNAALNTVQFWDGRAATLKDQAKGPLTNPIEMGMESHEAVVNRLKSIPGYVEEFKKIYSDKDSLTIENVAEAIASFEETLVVKNSAYDRYIKGDKTALSPEAKKGFDTFNSMGCVTCHSGANFSGPATKVGTGFYMKFPVFPDATIESKYRFSKDLGRFEVTKIESDKFTYRVPSLRNVAMTAPYFHNGSVNDLKEAIRIMAKVQLNRTIDEGELNSIAAFLGSLSDKLPVISAPRLPTTTGTAIFE